jgi:1,4-alpha-glucan branching enzyme
MTSAQDQITAATHFSRDGWAGGRVFAYSRADVRRYLIDNARMFLEEYHADGLRFDEVSVIDAKGGTSSGPTVRTAPTG